MKSSTRLFLMQLLIPGLFVGVLAGLPPAEVAKPSVDMSIYKHVDHLGWVVSDLDRVTAYWGKLGIRNIERGPERKFTNNTYRGKPATFSLKDAFADFGSSRVAWIQPLDGQSVLTDFLKSHGDGIAYFAYAVSSSAQLKEQVDYFKGKGVEVLQSGSWQGANGTGEYALLDTAPQGGGVSIKLVYNPDAKRATTTTAANDYPLERNIQFAPVVRDVHKVDAYYQRLGFGGMSIDHNISVDRIYRGQPGKFEMYLGWWRWPDVTFEWIQSLVGPSVYEEYLKQHGEGLHHIAFNVRDMDEAIKLFQAKGVTASQTGGWNNPGGSGRFAYLDTEPHGGVTIELLWNAPKK